MKKHEIPVSEIRAATKVYKLSKRYGMKSLVETTEIDFNVAKIEEFLTKVETPGYPDVMEGAYLD